MKPIGIIAARVVEGVARRHERVEELTEQASAPSTQPAAVVLIGAIDRERTNPDPARIA